jgi:hypothetical protein
MNQPVFRDSLYKTKDIRIAKMLMTMGLVIIKTEQIPRSKRKYFYFLKDRALPYVDRWNRGEPIPVSDIRVIYQAEDTINACIHDDF